MSLRVAVRPFTPSGPYVILDGEWRRVPTLERLPSIIRRWNVEHILWAHGMNRLGKALSLALSVHGAEKRSSGEPYIEHVVRVMQIIIETGCIMSEDRLIIALLHDIHEAGYSIDAIAQDFWVDIAQKVGQLSKRKLDAYLTGEEKEDFLRSPSEKTLRERRSKEYFWQLSYPLFDITLLIVKVADRIDNLETLSARSAEQIERILSETKNYFLVPGVLKRIPQSLIQRLTTSYGRAQSMLENVRQHCQCKR